MSDRTGTARMIVEAKFLTEAVIPVFDALGWIIGNDRTVESPSGCVIISNVTDTGSEGAEVRSETLISTINALLALHRLTPADPDPNQGLPEYMDLRSERQKDIATRHNLNTFPPPPPRRGVRSEAFANISTQLADIGRQDLAEAVWEALKGSQQHDFPAPVRKVEAGAEASKPPPAAPIFDYEKYRADPKDAPFLAEYETMDFIVQAKDMRERGRVEFELRQWVYSGTHFGNSTLAIHVVIDADNQVVSIKDVRVCLDSQEIEYTLDPKDGEAAQETDEGGDDHDGIPFEDIPKSLSVAEEEAFLANEGVMAAEEKVDGALVLERGDRFGIGAVYCSETGNENVRLQIGSNEIRVECNIEQKMTFLAEAARIAIDWMQAVTKGAEGTPPNQQEKIDEGNTGEQISE